MKETIITVACCLYIADNICHAITRVIHIKRREKEDREERREDFFELARRVGSLERKGRPEPDLFNNEKIYGGPMDNQNIGGRHE